MKDEETPGNSKTKDSRLLRQRTKDFAIQVIRMYSALPKSVEAQVLGKQVLRSGTSVGANIAKLVEHVQKLSSLLRLVMC
ncbi:MAG: four helix bundle protein [Geobacteraceae bacterium]|nr:four helix bundle protein [Geobacteraceae bacterium]